MAEEKKPIAYGLLTVVITIGIHTAAMVWWGATITARQNFAADQITELRASMQRLLDRSDPDSLQTEQINQLQRQIGDIEARMRAVETRRP